jgi:hypothetical protein
MYIGIKNTKGDFSIQTCNSFQPEIRLKQVLLLIPWIDLVQLEFLLIIALHLSHYHCASLVEYHDTMYARVDEYS